MTILSVKNKGSTTPGKLIGAYLSQQISSYLSLYALSKGITKSMIMRDQMEEWYREKRTINSEKELIETIANEAKHQWGLRKKSKYPVLDLESFRDDLKIELLQKGISKDHIEAIVIILFTF